jgi:thioredoxin reductase
VARLERAKPFPPGDYPVVVVGSGPGGLQTSYALSRLGIEHALISQDDAPGGMFRKWPIFQRLLSWTKPDAPYPRTAREYEWYDHNSLIADEPEHRGLAAEFIDRSWMVPSVPEMTNQLQAFAERTGVRVRTGCRWESTRREEDGFVLTTSDGEYRCRVAVFAVGVTEPLKSPIPGIEEVPHYAEARTDKESYRGRRVVVIGKRNSGFELADALVPWARQVFLVSPRAVAAEVVALSTVRVRYLQPYEDHSWGGGTFSLNAAVERIERGTDGWRVVANGTTHEGQVVLEADDVIAATGFQTPLLDLPTLGCATVKQGVLPAQTHHWESATVPGIYFAGNATQAAAGIRKHGVPSASGTVSGFRYNARLLAERIAARHFGRPRPRPSVAPDDVAPLLTKSVARSPELWSQKSYLARVVTLGGEDGPVDEGIRPLAAFLDEEGPDAIAAAVEMNGEGDIYPALYLRQGGSIHEDTCPQHPLHAFDGPEYTKHVDSLVQRVRL